MPAARALSVLLLIAVVAGTGPALGTTTDGGPVVELVTDRERYEYLDLAAPGLPGSVYLTFINHGPGPVDLGGHNPYIIENQRGEMVYMTSGITQVVTVPEGGEMRGRWDYTTQCRSDIRLAPGDCLYAASPGRYTAVWYYLLPDGAGPATVSTSFEIDLMSE